MFAPHAAYGKRRGALPVLSLILVLLSADLSRQSCQTVQHGESSTESPRHVSSPSYVRGGLAIFSHSTDLNINSQLPAPNISRLVATAEAQAWAMNIAFHSETKHTPARGLHGRRMLADSSSKWLFLLVGAQQGSSWPLLVGGVTMSRIPT